MTTFQDLVPNAPEGRFDGINRAYSPEEVQRLRGSVDIRYTLAERGANRLWRDLHELDYVNSLGAVTGNQAVQMVRAGLKAIYLSGWQVAADANTAGATYPDQSLYPANAGPELARRINKALQRADQVECAEGGASRDWFAPIVADAEAGFGGPLNCFEIMKAYIEAGAAGVHFEDQLASEKKCGHLGGKVLIPTQAHERNLNAARLAADVMGVPTLVMCRTDAQSAKLITSDADERDHPFIDFDAGRTYEGFYRLKEGMGVEHCIARALACADKSDLIWWETSTPNLEDAKRFAETIRKEHPNQMLAYNCSPSFNWRKNLSAEECEKFQREIAAMGYKFQFVTLAGFHALNFSMFELARGYAERGMGAYSELQQAEFACEENGYTATRHQREVGTGYFDRVSLAVTGGKSSTTAMSESTEASQFRKEETPAMEAAE
jgi:isocitrate lyase